MKIRHALMASLAIVGTAACQKEAAAPKPTLHEVMAGTIDPVADVIWTVSSRTYGDDGRAHSGILSDKEWSEIAKGGRDLHDGAAIIANNPDIVAVKPGVKILDEGRIADAVTARQVEEYIDRDRPGLTAHARQLMQIGLDIEAAAKARNALTTIKLAEELDEVCEACHKKFWYPDQPAPAGTQGAK